MPAPPKSCAEMFAKYLNNNNISVSNYVSEGLVRTQNITYLFDYYSPVYSDIATYTNQTSNNIYAESIFKYLGYTKYKTGSFETGAYVISDFLKEHSINTKGVRIVDGSGLSRQNMMTTRFMCNFLAEISKQPYYNDFVKTLSQIGKSGTAKNMLKNQPVKQEIYIKTGSMNGIKTYAGYIINKKGELISFCFMANNFECSQNKISQKLEQILLMIIEQ
jgi:D-alanyl-D-alanine carboxypeptidase/D-alanyl-D-alanine-endopeptidase (penicillin-binding protein 4)